MNRNQRAFILEISLNVLLLGFGLFIAFYLLLQANVIHQRNMALSSIQATMMSLTEKIKQEGYTEEVLYFNQVGEVSSSQKDYLLSIESQTTISFQKVSLRLENAAGDVLLAWDVWVNQ